MCKIYKNICIKYRVDKMKMMLEYIITTAVPVVTENYMMEFLFFFFLLIERILPHSFKYLI